MIPSEASTEDDAETKHVFDNKILLIMHIYMSICMGQGIVSFMLNAITIIAILIYIPERQPFILFILSLSVSDTVISFGLVVSSVFYLKLNIVSLCALKETLDLIGLLGNVSSIFLISVDRFISVTWPMHHITIMSGTNVKASLLMAWLGIIGISLGTLAFKIDLPEDKLRYFCSYAFFIPSAYYYSIVATGTLCTVLGLALSSKVVFASLKRQRFLEASNVTVSKDKQQKMERKVTKLMTSLLVVHFILLLPAMLVTIVDPPIDILHNYIISCVFYVIWYASPVANIVIYIRGTLPIENAIRKLFRLKGKNE